MPNAARFLLTAFVITLCAGPASHAQAPVIRGFPSDAVAAERQREEQFRKVPDSARLKEYMTAMAGEPHVAGRPGSRKVAEYALGQFTSWGLDAKIESFEALMPWPQRARARDGGADALGARHQGTGARGGSGLERRGPHPHLQRLLRRWRRHRRGRVRELRHARRLRPPRAARRQREGQDRARPLRRRLARHQAQGGLRTRRRRLPDLLGPARRRLLPGRCLSGGPVPPGAGRAARQRDGHARSPGRPAQPRLGVRARRQEAGAGRLRHHPQDPRACPSPTATRCRC